MSPNGRVVRDSEAGRLHDLRFEEPTENGDGVTDKDRKPQ
jgi:hypothetical protein